MDHETEGKINELTTRIKKLEAFVDDVCAALADHAGFDGAQNALKGLLDQGRINHD